MVSGPQAWMYRCGPQFLPERVPDGEAANRIAISVMRAPGVKTQLTVQSHEAVVELVRSEMLRPARASQGRAMPFAPPRYCGRGHPAFTGPRCPQCARDAKAAADKRRPNAAARGYTSDWQIARAAYLREHPSCVVCGAHATVVDHRIAHKGDTELFWSRSNWQSLCVTCHGRKTAKHDGAFGRSSSGAERRIGRAPGGGVRWRDGNA